MLPIALLIIVIPAIVYLYIVIKRRRSQPQINVDTAFIENALRFVKAYIELEKKHSASGFVSVLVSRRDGGGVGARLECCIFSLGGKSGITFDDIRALVDQEAHYAYLGREYYSVEPTSLSVSCDVAMLPTEDYAPTLNALKNEIKRIGCDLTVSVGKGAVMIGKRIIKGQ